MDLNASTCPRVIIFMEQQTGNNRVPQMPNMGKLARANENAESVNLEASNMSVSERNV